MYTLVKLALLLPSLVNAMPQYPGAVICDNTAIEEPSYKTKGTQDVTEQTGDQGWVNYDGQTCRSPLGQACQRQEGTELTKEVSVSFNVGGAFDLGKAANSGLDFGVSVAFSKTKTEATVQPCPASESDEEDQACVCGFQYKEFRQRAWGTAYSEDACLRKLEDDFDVTAPIKGSDGSPRVQWRTCRSKDSKCKNNMDAPLCADGL